MLGQNNSAEDRTLVQHAYDPGLIPNIPDGPLSPSGVITKSEHGVKSKLWSLEDVVQKQTKIKNWKSTLSETSQS